MTCREIYRGYLTHCQYHRCRQSRWRNLGGTNGLRLTYQQLIFSLLEAAGWGDLQGTPGANAGYRSMRSVSSEELSYRDSTGDSHPENATAGTRADNHWIRSLVINSIKFSVKPYFYSTQKHKITHMYYKYCTS